MAKETLLKFKEFYEKTNNQEQLAKVNRNLAAYEAREKTTTKTEEAVTPTKTEKSKKN